MDFVNLPKNTNHLTNNESIQSMEELYLLGQIAIFPWNWAPKHWAKCDGQLISISQNSALFSLIGTEFGGDGQVTFALPKMPPIKTANADGGDLAYYIVVDGIYPSRN